MAKTRKAQVYSRAHQQGQRAATTFSGSTNEARSDNNRLPSSVAHLHLPNRAASSDRIRAAPYRDLDAAARLARAVRLPVRSCGLGGPPSLLCAGQFGLDACASTSAPIYVSKANPSRGSIVGSRMRCAVRHSYARAGNGPAPVFRNMPCSASARMGVSDYWRADRKCTAALASRRHDSVRGSFRSRPPRPYVVRVDAVMLYEVAGVSDSSLALHGADHGLLATAIRSKRRSRGQLNVGIVRAVLDG